MNISMEEGVGRYFFEDKFPESHLANSSSTKYKRDSKYFLDNASSM